MRYIFNFPDIGEGLDEGTILKWYVIKGQEIKATAAASANVKAIFVKRVFISLLMEFVRR